MSTPNVSDGMNIHELFRNAAAAKLARKPAPPPPVNPEVTAFKDQLLMALLQRVSKDGAVSVSFDELKNTAGWSIRYDRDLAQQAFNFKLTQIALPS